MFRLTSECFILSYFHNMTGLQKHTYTLIHTRTHRGIRRRTPQDTSKDTSQTHTHAHIHDRQCLTNRYALTHTITHIHTHTLTICEFLWLQSQKVGWIFVATGIRHTRTHTICVHTLCPLFPRVFPPPSHLNRWSVKMSAVMDGSGPQDLYNVYLPV